MRISKLIVIAIAVLFLISSSPITASIESKKFDYIPENYLIEGVDYFSQETNFYCAYASYTMIFNYLVDQNLTLDEILFLSGVGYSTLYSNQSTTRIPMIGTILCQSPEYISDFFGYSDCRWYPKQINDINEVWEKYWFYVKENITKNNPVITSVNPFRLSSMRNLVDFHVPDWLISIGPKSGHGIVLIGFNESNSSVCFHDPAMGYFARPDLGEYVWMNLTLFKQSLIDLTSQSLGTPFMVISFKDNSSSKCLTKTERFNKALNLNIEKLKGNFSTYDSELFDFIENHLGYTKYGIGINATRIYLNNLDQGFHDSLKTMFIYKKLGKFGIQYRLMNKYLPIILEKLALPTSSGAKFTANNFDIISIEKNYTANFLKANGLSDIADLFYYESENWSKLSKSFNKFMEKGFLLRNKKSVSVIQDMYYYLGNVLINQQKIIDMPVFDIDFKINEFINRKNIVSVSAGIIKNNSIQWYGGYGNYQGVNSRFINKVPSKDTIYMAGSISKSITATAIMQLYEKGLFNLDDDVNMYLPFCLRNPNFPDKNITIRMLLNHTSSINKSSLKSLVKSGFSYITGYPLNYIKAFLLKDGFLYDERNWRSDYPPGFDYRYANMGFAILEYLVEYFSNVSYEKYCKENIFIPLEMYNSSFRFKEFNKANQAPSYIWKNGLFFRLPHYDIPIVGAGSLRTSVEDLSHFLIAHMNNGVYKDFNLLDPETIFLMHNYSSSADDFEEISEIFNIPNYVSNYGLGWMNYNSTFYNRNLSGHDGDTVGSHAVMRMDSINKTGFIFFWNSNARSQSYNGPWDIHIPLLNLLFEKFEKI